MTRADFNHLLSTIKALPPEQMRQLRQRLDAELAEPGKSPVRPPARKAKPARPAAHRIDHKEQAAGFAPLTLISADQALNDDATAEGLVVDDPRSHP
jgi:hypothetical protein